jgi:hypothetical protein
MSLYKTLPICHSKRRSPGWGGHMEIAHWLLEYADSVSSRRLLHVCFSRHNKNNLWNSGPGGVQAQDCPHLAPWLWWHCITFFFLMFSLFLRGTGGGFPFSSLNSFSLFFYWQIKIIYIDSVANTYLWWEPVKPAFSAMFKYVICCFWPCSQPFGAVMFSFCLTEILYTHIYIYIYSHISVCVCV